MSGCDWPGLWGGETAGGRHSGDGEWIWSCSHAFQHQNSHQVHPQRTEIFIYILTDYMTAFYEFTKVRVKNNDTSKAGNLNNSSSKNNFKRTYADCFYYT